MTINTGTTSRGLNRTASPNNGVHVPGAARPVRDPWPSVTVTVTGSGRRTLTGARSRPNALVNLSRRVPALSLTRLAGGGCARWCVCIWRQRRTLRFNVSSVRRGNRGEHVVWRWSGCRGFPPAAQTNSPSSPQPRARTAPFSRAHHLLRRNQWSGSGARDDFRT